MSPGGCQAIIWTNAGIMLIGNNFQWNLIQHLSILLQGNAYENVVWKMAAILSRPQCVTQRDFGVNTTTYGVPNHMAHSDFACDTLKKKSIERNVGIWFKFQLSLFLPESRWQYVYIGTDIGLWTYIGKYIFDISMFVWHMVHLCAMMRIY